MCYRLTVLAVLELMMSKQLKNEGIHFRNEPKLYKSKIEPKKRASPSAFFLLLGYDLRRFVNLVLSVKFAGNEPGEVRVIKFLLGPFFTLFRSFVALVGPLLHLIH